MEAGGSAANLTFGPESGDRDLLKVSVLYMNTSNAPLTELTLQIKESIGSSWLASFGGSDPIRTDEAVWSLPDLAPGEVARAYIDMQLVAANADTISIQPELRAEGLDGPARSTPITITVVR
jgi:hypothetical protein